MFQYKNPAAIAEKRRKQEEYRQQLDAQRLAKNRNRIASPIGHSKQYENTKNVNILPLNQQYNLTWWGRAPTSLTKIYLNNPLGLWHCLWRTNLGER